VTPTSFVFFSISGTCSSGRSPEGFLSYVLNSIPSQVYSTRADLGLRTPRRYLEQQQYGVPYR
jgi:hypothetical protein